MRLDAKKNLNFNLIYEEEVDISRKLTAKDLGEYPIVSAKVAVYFCGDGKFGGIVLIQTEATFPECQPDDIHERIDWGIYDELPDQRTIIDDMIDYECWAIRRGFEEINKLVKECNSILDKHLVVIK